MKKYTRKYYYEVGQEVNGLRIVEQTRKQSGNQSRKAYIVQSIKFPDAPTYVVDEYNLKKGKGCAYSSKPPKKIFEGNSLYSIDWVRPFIVDVEFSKTIPKNYTKPLKFKCVCGKEKIISPEALISNGSLACTSCTKGHYPELFFTSYLEAKGIEYEYQVKFEDSKRRIDFYIPSLNIYVETHGLQHYDTNEQWYETTHESDLIKRQWAIENDKELLELDCRVSTFEFIKNSIEKTVLPNIKDSEIKTILDIIGQNKKYPVKKIIKLYTIDKLSTYQIADELNINTGIIVRILQKNNINLRIGIPVLCIDTGILYSNAKEASRQTGINNVNISSAARGERKRAGGYTWLYLEELNIPLRK